MLELFYSRSNKLFCGLFDPDPWVLNELPAPDLLFIELLFIMLFMKTPPYPGTPDYP
jgi:hypothetical protein